MKRLLLLLLVLCSFDSPKDKARYVLGQMRFKYKKSWYHTLHFIQETEKYRNDSLIKKETWYETIAYPGRFRIDFGKPSLGNSVIFARDSAYSFKAGKQVMVRKDENDLLFLLGGMYFTPGMDSVMHKLELMGYDLTKYHHSVWEGRPCHVIGSDNDTQKLNQLWIDQRDLYPVRFLKFGEHTEEGRLQAHIPIGGGWTETNVVFYIDGKIRQIEKYHDCVANDSIPPSMFDPAQFGKEHWYKE